MGEEGTGGPIYLHFFTVSALVPCLFMMIAGASLLAIPRRSRATLHLGVAYLFLSLFMAGYAAAASVYHPVAAYHRWVAVGSLALCTAHFFLFLMHYPGERRTPASGILAVIIQLAAIALTAAFVAGTLKAGTFYDFEGHHSDLRTPPLDIPIALIVVALLVLMLITGIVRSLRLKGTARRSLMAITLITFIAIMAPGAANIASRYGILDRGAFQFIRDSCTMAGFFTVFLVHLNTTTDRTSIMTRLMGISLATFLIVLQMLSHAALSDMEKSYDAIRRRDLAMSIWTDRRPAGLVYLLAYSTRDRALMVLIPPGGAARKDPCAGHGEELFNTAMREEIVSTRDRGNPGRDVPLGSMLKTDNRYFNGYAGAIRWIAEGIPEAERDPGCLACDLEDLDRRVASAAAMIGHIPDSGFRETLRRRITGMDGAMAPFKHAILATVDGGSLDGAPLKREVLRYLAPMPPAGTRRYRLLTTPPMHVTSFTHFDRPRHILYEAGFDYRIYRAHQHPAATKFVILTGILVCGVYIAFQYFFLGAFLGPIRRILFAIQRVRQGRYDTVIPMTRRDELGYISHNFNEMMSSLDLSKEALSEYADNLSKMVAERTEELARARDELWGEMQIARKMQTIMIPRDPVMREYEITGYMHPAATMGGDYYDVIHTPEADWVIIGDVAGHGVPAGLIMMMAHTSIRALLGRGGAMSPAELLERVNDVIVESVKQIGDDRYMTATFMAFREGGECAFTGLHQDIIIYRAAADRIETVKTEGIWLGIREDARGLVAENTVTMGKNDIMFLYTDGITEAWKKGSVRNIRDPQKDMYGIDRLIQIFYENRDRKPDEIRDAVLRSLDDYSCTDDITMVILRKLP